MRFVRVFVASIALAAVYVGTLLYIDFRNKVFEDVFDMGILIGAVAAVSVCSLFMRSARWNWLLSRQRYQIPLLNGYLAYLAGFALTALPGKLGELLRIRYFAPLGVPANAIIACFFFERLVDLVVVLLLASLIARAVPAFWVGAMFATVLIVVVVVVSSLAQVWDRLASILSQLGRERESQFVRGFGRALSGIRVYFKPAEILVSLGVGLSAFGLQAFGFVYISSKLGFDPGVLVAVAIFPLATLVGAASMIPGGIGTTEAATVIIMYQFGAALETALVAAITMRLGTLWFAIAVGIVAAAALEFSTSSAPKLRQ